VTVCWLDDSVSLVRWAPRIGRRRVCRKAIEVAADSCDPAALRAALATLAAPAPPAAIEQLWIIAVEAFPQVDSGDARQPPFRLPEWITRCWAGLPAELLPERVISGLAAMDVELRQWPEYTQAGSGLSMRLGGRALFVGHGNGSQVRRFGRSRTGCRAESGAISTEWLLQTRLLFRNRTGMELRRVLMPDCALDKAACADLPFEVIAGVRPRAWWPKDTTLLDPGLVFLHASAVLDKLPDSCLLTLPGLQRRRRLYAWEQRLRLASGLLFCCWGFLLLGACRHEALADPSSLALHEWRQHRSELTAWNERWQGDRARAERDSVPLRLVGSIAETQPEGVRIGRVQLSSQTASRPGRLALRVEGTYAGAAPSAVFRGWMDQLRGAGAMDRIDNLQFQREGERIRYVLEGETAHGEAGQ
jgi:hypothetical protein